MGYYENPDYESTNSVAFSRLSDIANKNLSQIGSMVLHSTPQEFCANKEYMKQEDIKKVNALIRAMPKSYGAILTFPLIAFENGYLTEEQTIETITQFKTIEIVPSEKVRHEEVVFRKFKYEYCKKKQFFEYKTNDPDENYFYVSIANYALFPNFVKRYIPSFKVKIALPFVIDEMIEAAKERDA